MTDSYTGNIIPAYYFSSFECNLGIIFACGPALRQFWAYRTRTHSLLPTKARQYPNEDFEKMRYRINMRDIFWYRKAQMVGNRVFDASRIFRSQSPPPDASSSSPHSSSQVSNSILDVWEKKVRNIFGFGGDHGVILSKCSSSGTRQLMTHRPHVFARPRQQNPLPLRSRNLANRQDRVIHLRSSLIPDADGACSPPNRRLALAAPIGRPSCSPIVGLVQVPP